MKKPTVSVIIPTYNRAHLVGRAIKSVLQQTYRDFEIIIVDDGSSDNTDEIMKQLKERDCRIKYIKHTENRGGPAARNTGIKNAKGDYIAFLDSDDEWLPRKIEKQVKVFNHTIYKNLGFVYCGAIFIDINNNKEIRRLLPEKKGYIFNDLLEENCVVGGGSTCLIKKEVFAQCGTFDESEELRNGGSQEYEMWLRISKEYSFDFADDFLIRFSLHEERLSVTAECIEKANAKEYLINKFLNEYKENPVLLSGKYQSIGRDYCRAGQMIKARKYLLKSIKERPINTKSCFFLFISFLGAFLFSKLCYIKFKISNKN